jgi:hypothetical protein
VIAELAKKKRAGQHGERVVPMRDHNGSAVLDKLNGNSETNAEVHNGPTKSKMRSCKASSAWN